MKCGCGKYDMPAGTGPELVDPLDFDVLVRHRITGCWREWHDGTRELVEGQGGRQ